MLISCVSSAHNLEEKSVSVVLTHLFVRKCRGTTFSIEVTWRRETADRSAGVYQPTLKQIGKADVMEGCVNEIWGSLRRLQLFSFPSPSSSINFFLSESLASGDIIAAVPGLEMSHNWFYLKCNAASCKLSFSFWLAALQVETQVVTTHQGNYMNYQIFCCNFCFLLSVTVLSCLP